MLNEKMNTLQRIALVNVKMGLEKVPDVRTSGARLDVEWLLNNLDGVEAECSLTVDDNEVCGERSSPAIEPPPNPETAESFLDTRRPSLPQGMASPSSERKTVPMKRVKKLERRIKALESQATLTTKQNAALIQQLRALQSLNQSLEQTVQTLREQCHVYERWYDTTLRKLETAVDRESELRHRSAELKSQVKLLSGENEELSNRVKSLSDELSTLRTQIDALRSFNVPDVEALNGSDNDQVSLITGLDPDSNVGSNRLVISEELGYIDVNGNSWMFRSINQSNVARALQSETIGTLQTGDTVKLVEWSDGAVQLVPLQRPHTMPTMSVRTLPRKRRVVSLNGRDRARYIPHIRLNGDIVVVGGDCPSRYLHALQGLAPRVVWHNGFEQREKLEGSLRHAACVVTIETQISHWAMWRVKELAKRNHFIWKHVKIKSQSTVVAAVRSAIEEVGRDMTDTVRQPLASVQ